MYTSKFISYIRATLFILIVAGISSCIENDIPYPKIQPNFTSFEVENQIRPAQIDSASRTVTVFLSEEADISAVKVLDWGITKDAKFPDAAIMDNTLNLTNPIEVTMSIYQDYVWTISAVQNIERYFTVASQVGSSVIDPDAHTVKAYVPLQQPLTDIEVRSMKLAGTTAEYTPAIAGTIVDFTNPVKIMVDEFNRQTEWTITIEQTEISVDLVSLDAWTCVAWLYGEAEEGKANGFEYRLASEQDWTVVPAEWITEEGGSFKARLINLQPQTEYVARAISNDEASVERHFTTGSIVQLPNSTFTNWWMDGKVWCPWVEGEDAFWGTGNKGATTLGNSNTVPIDDLSSYTGYQGAKLESRFTGLGALGKLAAGNLFAGTYVRTVGTNGVLEFGREFTMRPTSLTAVIKYENVAITHASSSNPNFTHMKGQPDTCIVWVALADWDEPLEIRTAAADRNLFDQNDAGVIAYGDFQSGNAISNYTEVTIPLNYKSTSRVPKRILVTASASKYGDYFTGGNGSVLYVKEVKLNYNY